MTDRQAGDPDPGARDEMNQKAIVEFQSVDALLDVVAGLVDLAQGDSALRGHGLCVFEGVFQCLGGVLRELVGVQGLGLGDERRELGAVGFDLLDVRDVGLGRHRRPWR